MLSWQAGLEGKDSRVHDDALGSSGQLGLMLCSMRLSRPSDCCIGLMIQTDPRSPGPFFLSVLPEEPGCVGERPLDPGCVGV